MTKASLFSSFTPNRRVLAASLLSGFVIFLFATVLVGFLSAWNDMKEVVQDDQAAHLAGDVDTNFQLAISKGKNFSILKDDLNKTRAFGYFKLAQERYAALDAFETDPRGRDLLFKMGAALRGVEYSLGIMLAKAKKSDSAEQLYSHYLKDITIDFDEASKAYVTYLTGKINGAQDDLYSLVWKDMVVLFLGVLFSMGVIALSLSVTQELKRALANEVELKKKEERLQFFDNLTDETILVHDQGVIVEVNRALARLLGYTQAEMIGQHVSRFMDPTSTQQTQSRMEQGYPEGSYEIAAKAEDGSVIPLLVHGWDFNLGGRKVRASSGWDLREWKKAQKALQESQERFERFSEVTKEGIFIHDRGIIVDVNPALEEMLGYKASEIVGTDGYFMLDEASAQKVRQMGQTGYSDKPYELTVRRRDGSTFAAEFHGRPFSHGGKTFRVVSVWDVTGQKKAAEALRRSEENFRTLIESAPDPILVHQDGKVLYVNRRFLGFMGYEEKSQVLGRPSLELVHPEDREKVHRRMDKALQGQDNPPLEVRLLRKDGSETVAESRSLGIPFEGAMATMVIMRDTTDRRKAEENLRDSEEKFRSLIENSHDIIALAGEDGKVRYISPSVKRILGYDPSERLGQGFVSIMHPDDVERMRGEFIKLLAREGETQFADFRLMHKDGSWRHIDATGINLLGNPAIKGIIFNQRDVTEKVLAEEALRHSEENFRNLIENSNDVISLVGVDGKTRYVSPSLQKVMGYTPEERLGHSFFEIVHPDDQEMVRKLFLEFAYKPGVSITAEVRVRHKNGGWRIVDAVATNLIHHPVIRGIIFNYRDITERKLAEEALGQSEENFRNLIEKSPDGMVVHSPKSIVYVNEALVRLLGYEGHHQLLGKDPEVLIHPDYRSVVKERIQRLKPGADYNPPAERHLLTKEGGTVPVEAVSFSILFQGEPMVVAIVRDLTERKMAEENFKNLTEKSPDAIVIHNKDRIFYANPAFLKLNGYENVEELAGKGLEAIVPPEEREKVMARLENLQNLDGYNPPAERMVFTKKGDRIPVEVISFSTLFQGRRATVAVMRDLREKKNTEQALMKFERLSTIGEMAAGLAHEIRNPLAAIYTAAQLLKRQQARGERDSQYVETIMEQSKRLERLVEDTMDYARGGKTFEQEAFSVRDALEAALHLCQVQFGPSHPKVKVVWDLPPGDLKLKANPQRVQQILINLILNAYQIMPEGGTVTIGLKSDKNSAFIRVEDTGPGITDENMKRLFEPFFTTKGGGSGLGLALSQRIAKEHGGEILVERLAPKGTAFILRMPMGGEGKA